MELTVEFAGVARVLTRTPRVPLNVADDTSYQEILRLLGERYPQLLGEVLSKEGTHLQASNMLNLNGKHMIQPAEMKNSPQEGDRLILMSILAGG